MHLLLMHINRLINEYYLDTKIVDSLDKNNKELISGVSFRVDHGILLDFIKSHFYFYRTTDFLSKEILKYKYFISDEDSFDLKIEDNTGHIVLNLQKVKMNSLLSGKNREDIINTGWIFCTHKEHILSIKKHEKSFILNEIDFNEDYLSSLVSQIILSNRFRTEALNIHLNKLGNDFLENLKYIESKMIQYSKNESFKRHIHQVIGSLILTKEISPAINLIGLYKEDFWSNFK